MYYSNKILLIKLFAVITFLLLFVTPATQAQESATAEELAKKLSNPIASLISVPLQLNYDSGIGSDDKGDRFVLNVQPVIPISINEDWNLISRTIIPLMSQDNIFPGAGSQSGFGDIVQSVFFSPKAPTASGWVWGAGPVFVLPAATDDLLGAEKWGVGPTGVVLKQNGPWTMGALANHIWSFAGDNKRNDINSTFFQPFLSYTTPKAVSYAINIESTYDWDSDQWAIPVNLTMTKVTKIGGQLVSVGGSVRYWVESADSGPEGFGVRLMITLLYPK